MAPTTSTSDSCMVFVFFSSLWIAFTYDQVGEWFIRLTNRLCTQRKLAPLTHTHCYIPVPPHKTSPAFSSLKEVWQEIFRFWFFFSQISFPESPLYHAISNPYLGCRIHLQNDFFQNVNFKVYSRQTDFHLTLWSEPMSLVGAETGRACRWKLFFQRGRGDPEIRRGDAERWERTQPCHWHLFGPSGRLIRFLRQQIWRVPLLSCYTL